MDRLTVEVRPAAEHVARALRIEPGAGAVVRDRRYLVEGQPVMLATSHLAELVDCSPIGRPDPGPVASMDGSPIWGTHRCTSAKSPAPARRSPTRSRHSACPRGP
ncbi:UTRA domain-containing protein [Kitasatospora paracochleata]|uniref:UTRA domain-containing protein n=1 Tax=Kitasatospora paracochleata TaxID=58354 RepID=UPI0027E1A003|nr:UTRA domain-containing protein [Kitasatospora paracochleata]